MNNEIVFPSQITYFILWNTDSTILMSYGSVYPNQTMESAQPVMNTYLDEEIWLEILLENGIVPDEVE